MRCPESLAPLAKHACLPRTTSRAPRSPPAKPKPRPTWSASPWLSNSSSKRDTPSPRNKGTSTRRPVSDVPTTGPASNNRAWSRVCTSAAEPCPTSAASTVNSPRIRHRPDAPRLGQPNQGQQQGHTQQAPGRSHRPNPHRTGQHSARSGPQRQQHGHLQHCHGRLRQPSQRAHAPLHHPSPQRPKAVPTPCPARPRA